MELRYSYGHWKLLFSMLNRESSHRETIRIVLAGARDVRQSFAPSDIAIALFSSTNHDAFIKIIVSMPPRGRGIKAFPYDKANYVS